MALRPDFALCAEEAPPERRPQGAVAMPAVIHTTCEYQRDQASWHPHGLGEVVSLKSISSMRVERFLLRFS